MDNTMKSTYVTDVPLGAILPGRRQFIKTVSVTSESDRFSIELPGQITHCAGQTAFAIKPLGRINSKSRECRRAATVTASVEDEHGLDLALAPFRDRMTAQAPTGFAIRLASQLTIGEVFGILEKSQGGCGCGHGCGGTSLPGSLMVGLGWKNGEEIWSGPVAARLFLAWSYGPEDGVFAFDCHSFWSGFFDRRTDCEGPCKKPLECMCNDDNGNWRFWCKGWHVCICHQR